MVWTSDAGIQRVENPGTSASTHERAAAIRCASRSCASSSTTAHRMVAGGDALQYVERRVGGGERAFDVVDVPEQALLPRPPPGGLALGDEHVLVASDHVSGDCRSRSGQVLGIAVNDEVRALLRIVALKR